MAKTEAGAPTKVPSSRLIDELLRLRASHDAPTTPAALSVGERSLGSSSSVSERLSAPVLGRNWQSVASGSLTPRATLAAALRSTRVSVAAICSCWPWCSR